MEKKKSVYVGLSGGVDSSVSAYLLKEQGYDVTGVFIKVWHPDWIECDWKQDRQDAMRVCAQLGIPFKQYDFEDEYKKHVVDYMIEEYKLGRTPNPDVMCNKYVKFEAFLNRALSEGADYIATGHYARRETLNSTYEILKTGLDENKDQSYFLWTLTPEVLSKVLFPVGHLPKSEVRKLAEKAGLITAKKRDSQGLCFIGHVDMKEFLGRYIELKEGSVLDEEGNVIGKHKGAELYTIGQRHGFETDKLSSEEGPLFVVSKDMDKNTITVSQGEQKSLLVKEVRLSQTNWLRKLAEGEIYQVRFRYRQKLQKCSLRQEGESWVLSFAEPQGNVASGQSAVIYKEETLIGGGILS